MPKARPLIIYRGDTFYQWFWSRTSKDHKVYFEWILSKREGEK